MSNQQRTIPIFTSIFSFNHRPFAGAEMQAASHWNNRPDKLPWLQDPTTHFKLQCRQPTEAADQRLHPTEAQIATLPHYTGKFSSLTTFEDTNHIRLEPLFSELVEM